MKKIKPLKNAHTSNDNIGMGTYYGTGIRNPVGSMKKESMVLPKRKLGKPPKALA